MGTRARIEMRFGDGSSIDTWQKVSCRRTYTDPFDQFDFETIPIVSTGDYASYKQKLSKGEKVSILINDIPQGDYVIQTVDRTTSKDHGNKIKCKLHNLLYITHEADIDPDFALPVTTDISVVETALKIFGPYGFTRVIADTRASVSAVSGKPISGPPSKSAVSLPALKHGESTAHEGEASYKFFARIITRLGVCLRLAPDGTLLIGAPDYDQLPSATVVLSTTQNVDGDYFHGEVHVHETNDGQFSEITCRGQPSMKLGEAVTARPNVAVQATAVLPARCAYRSSVYPKKPKFFKDKSSRDATQTNSMAHLELGVRSSDSFTVEGHVNGWVSSTGVLWQPDLVVNLYHELEGIKNEPFWVLEIERTLDHDGEVTRLKLLPLGGLILGAPKS